MKKEPEGGGFETTLGCLTFVLLIAGPLIYFFKAHDDYKWLFWSVAGIVISLGAIAGSASSGDDYATRARKENEGGFMFFWVLKISVICLIISLLKITGCS